METGHDKAGVKRAWLLNLDADLELRHPVRPAPAEVQQRVAALLEHVAPLWQPGDAVVTADTRDLAGHRGHAWCPTPRALERLRALGAEPVAAPPLAVLQRVNHRAFCAALGQTLPGAAWVDDLPSLEAAVARPSAAGWLLKRPYSFAGTGQRRVHAGALPPGDRAWAVASLRDDGLQVEPIVDVGLELSLHGYVAPDGAVTLGDPCVQRVGNGGVWRHSRRCHDELDDEQRQALLSEGMRVGQALHATGYFGPFGLDAYRYGPDGTLNPRSEINARYTMGWALGMGPRRPDLAARA